MLPYKLLNNKLDKIKWKLSFKKIRIYKVQTIFYRTIKNQ